jgi:hypothetical protein
MMVFFVLYVVMSHTVLSFSLLTITLYTREMIPLWLCIYLLFSLSFKVYVTSNYWA